MPYHFRETIEYFCKKLLKDAPKTDLNQFEFVIDTIPILVAVGNLEGNLHMSTKLGLFVPLLREAKLKELAISNFLGIDTEGCKFSLESEGASLTLHVHTTCGNSPQENWEWIHRLICVARKWSQVLVLWEEFVPLHSQFKNSER